METKTEANNEFVESVGYTTEQFLQSYNELVDRMGQRIVVSPAFTATNHGTFELVLQYSVGKTVKK